MNLRSTFPAALLALLLFNSCSKSGDTPSGPASQADITGVDSRIASWMSAYAVPGATIAISRNGKLVYSKAYGSTEPGGDKITTDSRFRIANSSTIFTSAAIFKLVDQNKVSLTRRVFGDGSILGTVFSSALPYRASLINITLADLLKHISGGWGTNAPGDPAFYDSSWSFPTLMSWTIDNNPQVDIRGTNFRYSNFGYIVLARVIEKISGMSYADFVKQNLLVPAGATHTEIAATELAGRKTSEVKYLGQGDDILFVYAKYNYPRSDGAFGWISTASDLLRFTTAIDSSVTRPDILSPESITGMRTPSIPNPGYACGWGIDGPVWFVTGSLPGSTSFVYRNANGFCVAFLANTRAQPNPANANSAIQGIVYSIVADAAISWQDIDQF